MRVRQEDGTRDVFERMFSGAGTIMRGADADRTLSWEEFVACCGRVKVQRELTAKLRAGQAGAGAGGSGAGGGDTQDACQPSQDPLQLMPALGRSISLPDPQYLYAAARPDAIGAGGSGAMAGGGGGGGGSGGGSGRSVGTGGGGDNGNGSGGDGGDASSPAGNSDHLSVGSASSSATGDAYNDEEDASEERALALVLSAEKKKREQRERGNPTYPTDPTDPTDTTDAPPAPPPAPAARSAVEGESASLRLEKLRVIQRQRQQKKQREKQQKRRQQWRQRQAYTAGVRQQGGGEDAPTAVGVVCL
jgi:hypothetical protein